MGIEDSDGTCTWNKSLGSFDCKPRYLHTFQKFCTIPFSKSVCPYTLSFEKSSNPTNVYEETLAFNIYISKDPKFQVFKYIPDLTL